MAPDPICECRCDDPLRAGAQKGVDCRRAAQENCAGRALSGVMAAVRGESIGHLAPSGHSTLARYRLAVLRKALWTLGLMFVAGLVSGRIEWRPRWDAEFFVACLAIALLIGAVFAGRRTVTWFERRHQSVRQGSGATHIFSSFRSARRGRREGL